MAVDDKQAVRLRRHNGVDSVSRLSFVQPDTQCTEALERLRQPTLSVRTLLLDIVKQTRGGAIRRGGAHQDSIHDVASAVDRSRDAGEAGDQVLRIDLGEQLRDVGPVCHGDRCVVAADSYVQPSLEYA